MEPSFNAPKSLVILALQTVLGIRVPETPSVALTRRAGFSFVMRPKGRSGTAPTAGACTHKARVTFSAIPPKGRSTSILTSQHGDATAKSLPMTDFLHPWPPRSIRGPFAEVAHEAPYHQRGWQVARRNPARSRPFFRQEWRYSYGPLARCACVTAAKNRSRIMALVK
jgi:hypothetical protein